MVADWVIARKPHLVFVELCINDGDTLLETDDPDSLQAALEGIVRHIRDALPSCEVCLLYMFIRDDLPLQQRTGSKAWAENDDDAAVATYHERIPRLHGTVAAHYGLPSISLVQVMRAMPPQLRAQLFRDDCHVHDPGAALAAAAISAALHHLVARDVTDAATASGGGVGLPRALPPVRLPAPLHARPWGRGRAEPVTPQQLSFFYGHAPPADAAAREVMQQQLLTRHTQIDMDPLDNMQRKAWWLLYAGERAQVRFSGTRLGILTMIGPDAGVVTCDVDGGRHETRVTLLDRWSYFWRLAVVALVDELPQGEHVATLTLEAARSDMSVLKKPPSGPFWHQCKAEGKEHKLWLMHWLIEESSDKERAVVPTAAGAPQREGGTAARLGGAGLAAGGRRADSA